jgi:hypothetical protein
MFEIIMLFAFLSAAVSQLLPERPATTKAPFNKKGRHNMDKTSVLHRTAHKIRTKSEPSSEAKSQRHNYAYAA